MNLVDFLTEPFAYEFMTKAMLATTIAAAVSALLSCWLVLIGWSLMGDAVSHAVLPGVVLSYIVGVPFALGAIVFGVVTVSLIGFIRERSRVKEDAAIGIVFTTLFASGLVLISVTPSTTDLNHIIFGNVLGVSYGDLLSIAILGFVTIVVLLVKRRDLTLFAFDRVHAHSIGIHPRILSAILLGLLALTCVVALQVVGVILVVALLVIPGATAFLMTRSFKIMLIIAPTMSVLCSIIGLYGSFYLNISPGGGVVVVHGIAFAGVFIASGGIARILARLEQRRLREAN